MSACEPCLRRGLLLRELAPRIDRAVGRGAGRRARDLLALGDAELLAAIGAAPRLAPRGPGAAELTAELAREGCWALCSHDRSWPAAFERLGESAPRALFCRGDRRLLAGLDEGPAVTIVGSRRAGAYGREIARALGAQLALAGLPVISGMALGADSAAHEGALREGGTIAVLGAGPERPYPRSRARLYREICERGLVVSELPPASAVFRWTFPARNRLMAALGEITIVVEAAERSGTLITAEMAADCGRLVGAVPGPVNSWRSSGANRLLADGAALIRDARDVLELLLGPGRGEAALATAPALDDDARAALDAIEAGARGLDEVASLAGLGAERALSALTRLELTGYVELEAGGAPRRTGLAPGGAGG